MTTPPDLTPDTADPWTLRAYQMLPARGHRAGDAQTGWLLLKALDALLVPLRPLLALAGDRADGSSGWSATTDPDATPSPRWLGQWAGVVPDPRLGDAQSRRQIAERPATRRGTPAFLTRLVAERLATGARVDLVERDTELCAQLGGDPALAAYYLTVRVYRSHTTPAAAAAVQRALADPDTGVPVGLVWRLVVADGATYGQVRAEVTGSGHPDTLAGREQRFPLLSDVAAWSPPPDPGQPT